MEVSISKLTPHRKNSFFFDDLQGDTWIQLCDSITERGVINPIIITEDYTIVSGHQRVRACKQLGIEKIPAIIRKYESEDDILRELIETNICQRGGGGLNPIQAGRCIKELERIYNIKQGRPEKTPNNVGNKSQEDLLADLGLNKETYRQYKKLADLPEEIQKAVFDEKITPSVASRVIARMSDEDKQNLIGMLNDNPKASKQDVSEYVNELQKTKEENSKLRLALSESETKRILAEQNGTKEVIKEVEVEPADYEELKKKAETADKWENHYKEAIKSRQKIMDENLELKSEIRDLKNPTVEEKSQFKLEEESEYFVAGVYTFIKRNAGFIWIFDQIDKLPQKKREEFEKAIFSLDALAKQLVENIGGYKVE